MDKKAKERVAIAKDAMAWAKLGALIPITMAYVNPIDGKIGNELRENTDYSKVQARDVVVGTCEVCALGGLLMAKAVRYDNVLASELLDTPHTKLSEHFSLDQLKLIEYAFEGWRDGGVRADGNGMSYGQPHPWYHAFPDTMDRFLAIMQNIIRNKGEFVLTDLPA